MLHQTRISGIDGMVIVGIEKPPNFTGKRQDAAVGLLTYYMGMLIVFKEPVDYRNTLNWLRPSMRFKKLGKEKQSFKFL